MSRAASKAQSAPRSRRPWLYGLAALAVAVALGYVYFAPENPAHLAQQARDNLARDPAQAAELAQRAIAAAGGDQPDANLTWCLALGRQSNWANAEECFGYIRVPERCDGGRLLELAMAAERAGAVRLERKALEAIQTQQPGNWDIAARLVPLAYAAGDYDRVLELCTRWSAAVPADSRPLEAMADVYRKKSNMPLAAEAYRRALEQKLPEATELRVRSQLAGVLIELGQTAEARQHMDWVLEHGPVEPELRLKNANLLRLEGQRERALKEVETVLASNRDLPAALLLHAVVLLDLNRADDARADLERVVKAQPFNKEAHYKLAQALLRLGRDAEAQPHLDTSAKLTAKSVEILSYVMRGDGKPLTAAERKRLAELYDEIGQPESAARWRAGQ